MRKFVPSFTAILFVSFFITSCQKFDFVQKENDSFDVAASKEWWYGNFRKSADYSAVDYTSLFAPSLSDGIIATKKYPSWKDGISYKAGSLQFVELPLIYTNQVSIFPGSEKIDKNERIRIAGASLRKLLVIKKPDNSIIVRTVLLIPSPEYAKQKNYDISNNTLQNPDPNFSGWLVVKDWKETIINFWQIQDGKKVRKMVIREKGSQKIIKGNEMTTQQEVCYFQEVGKTGRICVGYTVTGDQPVTDEDCTNWYEYEYYEFEFVCQDSGGGDEPPGGCGIGITEEQCACVLYGICDGGGGWDEPPGLPEVANNVDDPCIRSSVNDVLSRDCKNQITDFINTVFANSDQFHLQFNDDIFIGADAGLDAKTSTGPMLPSLTQVMTNVRFNNAVLNGASKEYIAATILHEAVHAWIDYKFLNSVENAAQHNLMASTSRFNMLRDALLEMYPNLSPQDATDLTWGGMYDTIIFSNLPLAERNRIRQRNLDYRNRTNGTGTPC